MQSTDLQTNQIHVTFDADRVGLSSVPAGCVTKKWLCFTLRPSLKSYRADVVRLFFTQERLERCGIVPDQYPKIRVFTPEATSVIVGDLVRLGFIK